MNNCASQASSSASCGCNSAGGLAATNESAALQQTVFHIDNMDCRSEETTIRNSLQAMDGVAALEFDLPERTLTVSHTLPSAAPLLTALSGIGMHAQEIPAGAVHTTLNIPNMDCPTEERLIHQRLHGMAGIASLQFDLANRTLTLTHAREALATATSALAEIGFPPTAGAAPSACADTQCAMPAAASASCGAEAPSTSSCGCGDTAITSLTTPKASAATARQTVFRIENMDCPTEEALIRNRLQKIPEVTALDFNLLQRTLKVTHGFSSTAPLQQALSAIGMQAQEMPAKGGRHAYDAGYLEDGLPDRRSADPQQAGRDAGH